MRGEGTDPPPLLAFMVATFPCLFIMPSLEWGGKRRYKEQPSASFKLWNAIVMYVDFSFDEGGHSLYVL